MTQSYKSWAFTISLKDEDFIGPIQEWFYKWLKKQDHAFGVVELDKSGKRHAHAQIWNENASKHNDISRSARRKIEELHKSSVIFVALKVKIAYNDDYSTYMLKDIVETIIDNPPPGDTSKYYPTQEEQSKVKAESNAVDKKYHRWRTDFYEWDEKNEYIEMKMNIEYKAYVAEFLSYKIYVSKEYPVIPEKRKRVEATQNLFNYILGRKCKNQFLCEKDMDKLIQIEEIKELQNGENSP